MIPKQGVKYMKIALIGCAVLMRQVSFLVASSKSIVHTYFLEQGLHETPEKLRDEIQKTIEHIEQVQLNFTKYVQKYDAIVLAYGLCSNGILGLRAKTLPLIVPRCDDCIALFLGSQEKYLDIFNSNNGIYWYNKAWCENTAMPSKELYEKYYAEYTEQYDEDTANYLMQATHGWRENYENVYFIKSAVFDDNAEQNTTKQICKDFNWNYIEVDENLDFLKCLTDGNFNSEKFAVCKPGQEFVAEYTGKKVVAKNI